jgi:hypothetical protein
MKLHETLLELEVSGPGTGLSVRSAYPPFGPSDRTLREIDSSIHRTAAARYSPRVSDPFRSELESAHARNAQLCDENARLRKELDAARQPSPRSGPTRRIRLVALVVGGLLLLLASLFFLTAQRQATAAQAAPAASPGDYRGIAIATPAEPSPGASEPDPPSRTGNAAPQPESQRRGARPCACAKGDPVCDCCNPPFVEDSTGHKVFKAGCL